MARQVGKRLCELLDPPTLERHVVRKRAGIDRNGRDQRLGNGAPRVPALLGEELEVLGGCAGSLLHMQRELARYLLVGLAAVPFGDGRLERLEVQVVQGPRERCQEIAQQLRPRQ